MIDAISLAAHRAAKRVQADRDALRDTVRDVLARRDLLRRETEESDELRARRARAYRGYLEDILR